MKFIDLLRSQEQTTAAALEQKKKNDIREATRKAEADRAAALPMIEAARLDITTKAAEIEQLQIEYDRIEAEARELKAAYLDRIRQIGGIMRSGRYDLSTQIDFLKQHNEPIPARRYLVCEIENKQHNPAITSMLSSREIQTALQQGKNGL